VAQNQPPRRSNNRKRRIRPAIPITRPDGTVTGRPNIQVQRLAKYASDDSRASDCNRQPRGRRLQGRRDKADRKAISASNTPVAAGPWATLDILSDTQGVDFGPYIQRILAGGATELVSS
jgi:hypothetical protein